MPMISDVKTTATYPRSYVICQYSIGDVELDVHGFLDSDDYGYEVTKVTLIGHQQDLGDLLDYKAMRRIKDFADDSRDGDDK